MRSHLTFLGTGTSVGVPMINCDCPVCQSTNPKDKRLRSSVHLASDDFSCLIDTGPDFRQQCLRAGITTLDEILFTHAHTDHIVGMDDLRRFTIGEDEEIALRGSVACLEAVKRVFPYAFDGSARYRGYLKARAEPVDGPFRIGSYVVEMLPVEHGNVETHGFLFTEEGRKVLAYFPDCKRMPEQTGERIRGVETLITGALRATPHPTHQTLDEAVALAQAVQSKRTWLTHFMCEVGHDAMLARLPPGIQPAYDGLILTLP